MFLYASLRPLIHGRRCNGVISCRPSESGHIGGWVPGGLTPCVQVYDVATDHPMECGIMTKARSFAGPAPTDRRIYLVRGPVYLTPRSSSARRLCWALTSLQGTLVLLLVVLESRRLGQTHNANFAGCTRLDRRSL